MPFQNGPSSELPDWCSVLLLLTFDWLRANMVKIILKLSDEHFSLNRTHGLFNFDVHA